MCWRSGVWWSRLVVRPWGRWGEATTLRQLFMWSEARSNWRFDRWYRCFSLLLSLCITSGSFLITSFLASGAVSSWETIWTWFSKAWEFPVGWFFSYLPSGGLCFLGLLCLLCAGWPGALLLWLIFSCLGLQLCCLPPWMLFSSLLKWESCSISESLSSDLDGSTACGL